MVTLPPLELASRRQPTVLYSKSRSVAASFEHVANDETHTFCSFISAHSNPDVERTGELS
ncbi:MAG: hypothetical protein WBW69_18520 [Candidatus Korobacteraceae bacterium]